MFPSRHESSREVILTRVRHISRYDYSRSICCGGGRYIFRSSTDLLYIPCLVFLLLHLHILGGSACGLGLTPHGATAVRQSPQHDSPQLSKENIRPDRVNWTWTTSNRRFMGGSLAASTLPGRTHKRSRSRTSQTGAPILKAGAEVMRDLKMALAGAFAGAVATETTGVDLRGRDPFKWAKKVLVEEVYNAVKMCLQIGPSLPTPPAYPRTRGALAIYTGLPTAVFGAMPSSALYFGTYEAVKSRLLGAATRAFLPGESEGGGRGDDTRGGAGESLHPVTRAAVHALAAACGNAASSLIFVPKEYVKQKIQASGMAAAGSARETATEIVRRTLREKGVRGLYCGYRATLSRNIPSAVIRFSVYEELKILLGPERLVSTPPVYLLVGAVAGGCASGLTTPFDVLKTRVATGSLDGSRGLARNMVSIVAENGWQGLFAGFQPRVIMSGLFTAVGFSSFETFKSILGVSPLTSAERKHEKRNASLMKTPSGTTRR